MTPIHGGTIALHGGGEFLPGDEPFLRAILDAAAVAAATRAAGHLRVAVVPTAAARGRPDLAASHGVVALERVARAAGLVADVRGVRVVDEASAMDPALAAMLAAADLIHLPGGDPDLIPSLYPRSSAWAAIEEAMTRGSVLAGASAGAMGLAELTWTPSGLVRGLGLVRGRIVAPHADARSWAANLARFGARIPAGFGVLGLAERTGIVGPVTGPWRVVGEGEVRWLPVGARDPDAAIVRRHGDELPAIPDGPIASSMPAD